MKCLILLGRSTSKQIAIQCRYLFLFLLILSCTIFSQDFEELINYFTPQVKAHFSDVYGTRPARILDKWLLMITENQDQDIHTKLELVNYFFNKKIKFVDDIVHWHKEDYWATPVEFIGTKGGDCEDYALAKYFTLKAMGVDPAKLRLMYVRALRYDQAHMVLIYSNSLDQMPLILDNLNPRILPANKRRDLKPIYSFNGDGLWLAKAKGLGKQVKGKGGVTRWSDIVSRIENNEFKTNR